MKSAAYQRNDSLDALRGLAILLMVLSGSIAFGGVLPAWMYHAQVPPPLHTFNPDIPGITWVDLVFPFFLFSMGAAMPLALKKFDDQPNATTQVWWIALRRYVLLTWFALFIYHMRAWVISDTPGTKEYLLSIAAFALLFFQLYKPSSQHRRLFLFLQIGAYATGALLLAWLPFHKGNGFRLDKSDIIILVLANMAFFGTILFWHTRNNAMLRWGILPFLMAIFLSAKTGDGWQKVLFEWSPLPWMYKLYYLKYLFIIIPGTFAGAYMLRRNNNSLSMAAEYGIGMIGLALIICNVLLLFYRHTEWNLLVTVLLSALGWYILRNQKQGLSYIFHISGTYLLLLGLCFEAYEGGIKKDSSTYSYYFVTAGLAFFMLNFLGSMRHFTPGKSMNRYLAANGQNPMVAYVAGSLLLTPLLQISGLAQWHNMLQTSALTGFLKGLWFTAVVSLITWFFTRKKWFWKS